MCVCVCVILDKVLLWILGRPEVLLCLLNVRIHCMCMVSHEISISVSLSVYSLTVLDIRLEDLPTLGKHSTLYCQPTPYC